MHNAAFAALGLDFVYLGVRTKDFRSALDGAISMGFVGCSVSMPYKERALDHVEQTSSDAELIGAINTIYIKDGVAFGSNTDSVGATRSLREHLDLTDAPVAVVGAGGVGRAIIFGLLSERAIPTLFNRSEHRGRAVAELFGIRYGGSPASFELASGSFAAVVNATSVGMDDPNRSPIRPAALAAVDAVLDVVYPHHRNRLRRDCEAAGVIYIHGTEMLVQQGAAQFKIFTGVEAPVNLMRRALQDQIQSSAQS